MNAYLWAKNMCNIGFCYYFYYNTAIFAFTCHWTETFTRFLELFIEWNFSSGIAFLFYASCLLWIVVQKSFQCSNSLKKKEWIFYYDSYNHHEWLFCYDHVGRLLRQRLQPKAHGLYLFIQIFIDTNFSRNSQCFPLFICSRQFYNSSFCTTFALFTFALKY